MDLSTSITIDEKARHDSISTQDEELARSFSQLRGSDRSILNVKSQQFIVIPLSKGQVKIIESSEVRYIESEGQTTRVYSCQSIRKEKSLHHINSVKHIGYFSEQLKFHDSFFQFSQSLIVNLRHLDRYKHNELSLRMDEGEVLYASRRGGQSFRRWANQLV